MKNYLDIFPVLKNIEVILIQIGNNNVDLLWNDFYVTHLAIYHVVVRILNF